MKEVARIRSDIADKKWHTHSAWGSYSKTKFFDLKRKPRKNPANMQPAFLLYGLLTDPCGWKVLIPRIGIGTAGPMAV